MNVCVCVCVCVDGWMLEGWTNAALSVCRHWSSQGDF